MIHAISIMQLPLSDEEGKSKLPDFSI